MTKSGFFRSLDTREFYMRVVLFFSLSAVVGSLYYQNFGDPVTNLSIGNIFANNGLLPCTLCWWQRIFMYPIALIAVVAWYRKDWLASWYIAPLAFIGLCFATYHYIIQKLPIKNVFDCSLANPCSATEVNYLGFITIPLLAWIAFVGIFIASARLIQLSPPKQ